MCAVVVHGSIEISILCFDSTVNQTYICYHCFATFPPPPPSDAFIVLACDGIFDVMTNQDVVDFMGAQLRHSEGGGRDGGNDE